jgi:sugar-specific transcriptional regulator TrmB
MDSVEVLQKLNLSPSEARTYLAVLNAGELKISEVAKLIGTTKMAGYTAVDKLRQKGLLAEVIRSNKRFVIAEDPERLIIRLKEENRDQERALEQLLPELKTLYSHAEVKPSVKVFQGIEGLKSVYEDTLKTMKPGDSYVAFGSIEEAFTMLKDYLDDYVDRRVKKQISFRGIAPADKMAAKFTAENTAKLREVRLVAKDQFPFRNEIDIYANKVAILSFKDKIGLIIESKQIADTQRAIFELAWKGAEYLEGVSV